MSFEARHYNDVLVMYIVKILIPLCLLCLYISCDKVVALFYFLAFFSQSSLFSIIYLVLYSLLFVGFFHIFGLNHPNYSSSTVDEQLHAADEVPKFSGEKAELSTGLSLSKTRSSE